ncbi:MAG: cation transporter, partial [Flavobacteriaceae bacterium]|nr:cation transporter [Flavobacteriaceae bacterium]
MPNKNLIYISVFSFFIPLFANGQSATETLFVDGVCGMCKDRIEAAALQSKGVESADWDLESHQLTVTYDPTEFKFNRLQRQLADVGHDTDKYEAPQEAYDQLHSCCKYRDPEIIASHQPAPAPSAAAIFVNGICGMCKDRIEAAALHTQGVKTASWNLSTRMLYVDVDPDVFSEDQLHWAVTAVGHDTREWLANDAAYQSLDDCCKYRELADPVPAEDPVFQDIALLDQFISGTIFESAGRNKKAPLVGVNIYWEDTKSGTFTDENGHFEMARNTENQLLVVSYVGYAPDTIDMSDQVAFELMLSEAVTLDAVEVNYRRKSSDISFIDPIKTLQIDQKELLKAACCNLSESFETNPSVDVSFTDAVTGTRQIQMLGLAGPYVQITQESMPGARALSSIQGLTYIPGPWISGIQLIKGPGSVVNGYESMTGQINVELKKPENSERLYVNLYANEGGRFEANINSAVRLNEKVSTGILLHGNMSRQMNDRNTDGFLDNPIGNNFIAINRWKFENINGWNGQIGIKATLIDKASGQLSENYDTQFSIDNPLWTMIQNTARYEIWAKMGRVFPNNPTSSIGFQASGVMHEQTFSFGSIGAKKLYEPNQKSAYFNMIY